jgi:hypothetical protein
MNSFARSKRCPASSSSQQAPGMESSIGFTGGGPARSFYGRPFTKGLFIRSRIRNGRGNITMNNAPRGSGVIRPSAHWRLNGFAYYFVAGRNACRTTKRPIVPKYMVRHRKPPSQTWRTFLENHVKTLVSVDFLLSRRSAFEILLCFWCWRMSADESCTSR